jgi:hypothetical protein
VGAICSSWDDTCRYAVGAYEVLALLGGNVRRRSYCFFAFRLAAQYFFIRSLTALRAAADIRLRERVGLEVAISAALEVSPGPLSVDAIEAVSRRPFRSLDRSCGNILNSEDISAWSS